MRPARCRCCVRRAARALLDWNPRHRNPTTCLTGRRCRPWHRRGRPCGDGGHHDDRDGVNAFLLHRFLLPACLRHSGALQRRPALSFRLSMAMAACCVESMPSLPPLLAEGRHSGGVLCSTIARRPQPVRHRCADHVRRDGCHVPIGADLVRCVARRLGYQGERHDDPRVDLAAARHLLDASAVIDRHDLKLIRDVTTM